MSWNIFFLLLIKGISISQLNPWGMTIPFPSTKLEFTSLISTSNLWHHCNHFSCNPTNHTSTTRRSITLLSHHIPPWHHYNHNNYHPATTCQPPPLLLVQQWVPRLPPLFFTIASRNISFSTASYIVIINSITTIFSTIGIMTSNNKVADILTWLHFSYVCRRNS